MLRLLRRAPGATMAASAAPSLPRSSAALRLWRSSNTRPSRRPVAAAGGGGGGGGGGDEGGAVGNGNGSASSAPATRSGRSGTRSRSPAGPGGKGASTAPAPSSSGRRTRQNSAERAPSSSSGAGRRRSRSTSSDGARAPPASSSSSSSSSPPAAPYPAPAPASPSPATASPASPALPHPHLGSSAMMELVSNPDIDDAVARAPSASDAAVLRRKGHLKEQDRLIDFMRDMHATHTCEEVMAKVERWVADHRQDPRRSRLRRVVPTVGSFFTPLGLVDAFAEYDAVFHLSRRRYIPPNFAELRHVLNIAQVRASAEGLRLVTFDADGTLYADGHHIEQDSAMVETIVALMRAGVHVGIVTAAGYPGDASKFEGRIAGLLGAFDRYDLPPELTARFHLMGGECNYLLRVTRRPRPASASASAARGGGGGVGGGSMDGGGGAGGGAGDPRLSSSPSPSGGGGVGVGGGGAGGPLPLPLPAYQHRLEFVPDDEWQTPEMLAWDAEEVVRLLDAAQAELVRGAARLCLPVSLIRKTRSVGVVPAAPTIYEVLEELALTVQQQLSSKLPFCAFNGGNDVFVDVGNKSLGLDALMRHLGCYPHETLHVGDRFTDSGNDTATRDCCSIVWVANPEETSFFMRLLLRDLAGRGRGVAGGVGAAAAAGGGMAAAAGGNGGNGGGWSSRSLDEDLEGGDGRRGRGRRRTGVAGPA